MSFKDYINQYRIEHYIHRVETDPDVSRITQEALAIQCGFNNRQTFTNAFKKHTSMTPSAYFKEKTA